MKKGIEAENRLRQNELRAESLTELLVTTFYGGNHPNVSQIATLVEAFLGTMEFQVSDDSWLDIIVMRVAERLGVK